MLFVHYAKPASMMCGKEAHTFVLKNNAGRFTLVPKHGGEDIGRGLLRQILRDANITPEEFLELLNN
mgnify:CR=1 FL=1